jgi:drug/metabolite transporter (DMT)-like permease
MFLLGVLGVAASNYCYYLAIQRTSVATAITVQYTAPVWVLLYTVAAGAQRATLRRLIAVVLAIGGIVLVVGFFRSGGLRLDAIGVIAALLAAFSFAFYNIGGHNILARYDHWIVLLYITFSASVFWAVINPPWKIVAHHYSTWSWIFLFVFSLVSVLAPFSFYIAGLRNLDPTRAIVVSCLEPVFSIVIAAIALGEIVRPLQALGIVLVLAGILVVQIPDRRSREVVLLEPIE